MKKVFLLFMLLSLIFACSCARDNSTIGIIGGADGPTSIIVGTNDETDSAFLTDFFVDRALEHTVSMGELAADPGVRTLYSSSEQLNNEVAAMGEGDYSNPTAVYKVKISHDGMANYLIGQSGIGREAVNKLFGANRIKITTLVTTYNATFGANKLAAASVTSQQEGYVMSGFEGNIGILLEYDGAYSSFTAYEKIGDGVVEGTTNFLYNDEENNGIESFIASVSEFVGEENINFEKVK